jgi:hypothetical protein
MCAPLQRPLRSSSPSCPPSPCRGRSRSCSRRSYRNHYRSDERYRTDRYRSRSRARRGSPVAGPSSQPRRIEGTISPCPPSSPLEQGESLVNHLADRHSLASRMSMPLQEELPLHPYRGRHSGKRNRKPGDRPGLGSRPKMSVG